MQKVPCIAIVGRPNVGKSRLFNRLARSRRAIVFGQPGVTRDIISAQLPNGATLLDTGGIGQGSSSLDKMVDDQVQLAIAMADTILFVLDGREGLTAVDLDIAKRLRRSGKRILPIVNKIDSDELLPRLDESATLGFGEGALAISAEHDRGIDVLERHLDLHATVEKAKPAATVALIGAPNAGKSSIMNRLLRSPRMVVSGEAGTTRDSVASEWEIDSSDSSATVLQLVDTAGLRLQKKIASPVEFFASRRTDATIRDATLSLLVIDAIHGLTKTDKKLADSVAQARGNLAIIVNKWDLVEERFRSDPPQGCDSLVMFREQFGDAIRRELYGWPNVPVLFISALLDRGFAPVRQTVRQLLNSQNITVGTGVLNRFLATLLEQRRPPKNNGKQFKIFYGLQTSTRPQIFRIYCNNRRLIDRSYEAFIRKRCLEKFFCGGCSLTLDFVSKTPRNRT